MPPFPLHTKMCAALTQCGTKAKPECVNLKISAAHCGKQVFPVLCCAPAQHPPCGRASPTRSFQPAAVQFLSMRPCPTSLPAAPWLAGARQRAGRTRSAPTANASARTSVSWGVGLHSRNLFYWPRAHARSVVAFASVADSSTASNLIFCNRRASIALQS